MAETALAPVAAPDTLGRSSFIAWLRVLAIAGVVLIHVSGSVTLRQDLSGTPVFILATVMNGATRFCVPLFVLVSGSLLLRPSAMKAGMGAFYRKRLTRLVPALVVWHLVYLAFREFVRGQHITAGHVATELLSGKVYTALYFFWLILGLYLVAPLLWNAMRDFSSRQRLILGLILVALTCTWQSTLGIFAWQAIAGGSGAQTIWTLWIPYVGYFVLGGALRDLTPSLRTGLMGLGLAALGMCVTTWQAYGGAPTALKIFTPPSYWGWLVAMVTVGLWLAAAWFWRSGTWASRGLVGRLGELLGSLTLGVFAVHLIVLYFVEQTIARGLATGSIHVRGLLAVSGIVLLGAWAIAWAMSRVPWLRRIV